MPAGTRAAALHRDHAGRARRARRLPARVLCTPPRPDGRADPAVLVAARRCGVTQVFKVGGAQAMAAMAYGTATVPKVDKIFGPGNAWVTAAKQLVAADAGRRGARHAGRPVRGAGRSPTSARDPRSSPPTCWRRPSTSADAQVVLVTDSRALAERGASPRSTRSSRALPRARPSARRRSRSSRVIVVPDIATRRSTSQRYAPEHLILQVARAARLAAARIRNAGSVFLGAWSPEPMGDYCSGTNHVLPTYGYARAYSGLSCTISRSA